MSEPAGATIPSQDDDGIGFNDDDNDDGEPEHSATPAFSSPHEQAEDTEIATAQTTTEPLDFTHEQAPPPETASAQNFSSGDATGSAESIKIPDPVVLGQALFHLMEKSQPLMRDFMERIKLTPPSTNMPNPMSLGMNAPWMQMTQHMLANPQKMVDAQLGLWQDYMKLWQNTTKRFLGQPYETIIQPQPNDKRFKDGAWSQNTLFDFIKQSYLLTSQWMQKEVQTVEGIDATGLRKVEFYTRQFIDALSPTNFLFTNPEVLRLTAETGGDNLVKGLQNLLQDLERGQGQLKISMTDTKAFELGKNIATTAGKVVFQNDMMQLIQYEPLTDAVHTTPLLIIPPWINKYYILDMREKNSLVRYCLEQGHTVFMISWVNPDSSLAAKDFASYMLEGPFAALQEIKRRTGAAATNVVGYCIGGTLLSCLLAYLQERPEQAARIPLIASATYLVTMTDFSEPGELGLFVDEDHLQALEKQMDEQGYLDGATMGQTFSMLRANDLIWSFVVNNYLLGREPFPFDLLFWNSDTTRMPAAMHKFYLRKMYQENRLIESNGIMLDNTPIDIRKIKTPSFMLSTREDHIAPWKSTYAATQLYSGAVKFVLSGSGHVAGVVNPPTPEKYGYWTNESLPASPDEWLKDAKQTAGSWWPAWMEWLKPYQGREIAAQEPAEPILENAPGSYVLVRADEAAPINHDETIGQNQKS
jgi:polyhydroxyalkanoate synthase